MRRSRIFTPELQERRGPLGRLLALAGGVVLTLSALLPWSYGFDALDGMTLLFYPSPLQVMGLVLGLLVAAGILCSSRFPARRGQPVAGWLQAARAAATGALLYLLIILISIAAELGGLVNIEYGGWVALVGALLAFVGTRLVAPGRAATLYDARSRSWM
jgi:branched-chain amino acid transport system permease protein